MKKYLVISLVFLASLFTAQAQLTAGQQIFATNNLTAGAGIMINEGVTVNQLQLYSTNLTPTIVRLYDGWYVYTNAAFTNYTTYLTNIVTTYTNTTGTTNTFTNSVLFSAAAVTAASTNNNTPPIVSFIVPANNVPITINGPFQFSQKLTLSNNLTGLSGVILYHQP
jgi:hypothetical protein